MGIFSKLLGIDQKAAQEPACDPLAVYAPVGGEVIPLEQFPDAVFSQGILGPGCGVFPSEKVVHAPFNGTVIQCTDTMHAVGLSTKEGLEVLIHVGVDTVDMAGKGFRCHVKEGQKVSLGDPLITFEPDTIKAAGHSDAIAVVVTNSDEFTEVALQAEGYVGKGAKLLVAKR